MQVDNSACAQRKLSAVHFVKIRSEDNAIEQGNGGKYICSMPQDSYL